LNNFFGQMHFEENHLFHIYNQGNNRQRIFFCRENYLFFTEKIKIHILPYADILAWCLMPNHFHLMVYVKQIELEVNGVGDSGSGSATLSRTPTATARVDSFNKSIGIMLASYTRAINKQQNSSGSLFRDKTKAVCLTKTEGVTPAFINTSHGAIINVPCHEMEYPQICFNYIHFNPVKANLVKRPEDWEFSSYNELNGKEILINKNRIKEFGLP